MNATTTTAQVTSTDILHAKNIAGVRWADEANMCAAPSRSYGITDAAGRWLSSDGTNPSCWGSLTAARMVVEDLIIASHDEQFTPGGIRTGWTWVEAA